MNIKTIRIAVIALGLSVAVPGLAPAHEATKGANGGTLISVKGGHIELVPSTSDLTFYLLDTKDAPLSTAGAKTKAIVQSGGKTMQLDLTPAEPNKLTTPISAALRSGAKVVVSGTLADGHSLQGRFVVP